MVVSVAESRHELGITEKDLAKIRRGKKDPNKVLLFLIGVLASIGGFFLGYFLDMENHPGYPYAALGLSAAAAPLKRKGRWLAMILVILASFLSFVLGAVVADPPNYGLTAEYSVASEIR